MSRVLVLAGEWSVRVHFAPEQLIYIEPKKQKIFRKSQKFLVIKTQSREEAGEYNEKYLKFPWIMIFLLQLFLFLSADAGSPPLISFFHIFRFQIYLEQKRKQLKDRKIEFLWAGNFSLFFRTIWIYISTTFIFHSALSFLCSLLLLAVFHENLSLE